jgi:hypothetical protein
MKVTFYSSACSNGMSDRTYAYSAEVDLQGESPLNGCADTAATLAKGAQALGPKLDLVDLRARVGLATMRSRQDETHADGRRRDRDE